MSEAPSRSVHAANAYGRFTEDGREYVITDPRTPRPWVNVISNARAGLVVSQTGSGFTWVDNSQLAVVTRWEQDLTRDSSGRFLYVRDVDTGEVWSLSPAPCLPAYDRFECRHGLGYTTFRTAHARRRGRLDPLRRPGGDRRALAAHADATSSSRRGGSSSSPSSSGTAA